MLVVGPSLLVLDVGEELVASEHWVPLLFSADESTGRKTPGFDLKECLI